MYSTSTPGETWKMEDILETIRAEVEAREASNLSKGTQHRHSSSKLLSSSATPLDTKEQLPRCVYCQGEHYLASCSVVKTVKDRRSALIQGGRCFICLRTQHRTKDCEMHKKCRLCHGQHLQSLCEWAQPVEEPPPKDNSVTKTASNTCNVSKVDQLVLLQTARALASNNETRREVTACVLFDKGSQRSYITNTLANQLRLRSLGK